MSGMSDFTRSLINKALDTQNDKTPKPKTKRSPKASKTDNRIKKDDPVNQTKLF